MNCTLLTWGPKQPLCCPSHVPQGVKAAERGVLGERTAVSADTGSLCSRP